MPRRTKFAWPPVVVEWNDAHIEEADATPDTLDHAPFRQFTLGWLIREDRIGVSVAVEYSREDSDDIRTIQFVPRGMVVKVHRL